MDINQIIANIVIQFPAIAVLLIAIRQIYEDARNDRMEYDKRTQELLNKLTEINLTLSSLDNQISNLVTEYRRINRL